MRPGLLRKYHDKTLKPAEDAGRPQALFTWSGGKDSAMALHELVGLENRTIIALLTAVTEEYGRVSMHGVRESLLALQAESIGIPLLKIVIPKDPTGALYEERMREVLLSQKSKGIAEVVFGDIFLKDVREYREGNLARVGMKGIFPLWGKDTSELARSFIARGFKAVTTCVDTDLLGKEFTGREFDRQFLRDLPAGVDPCGENGEFHTFVYDGPLFRNRIVCRKGERVLREEHFYFCDLLPG